MPTVDIAAYEALTPADLEKKRAALLEKNRAIETIEWPLEDLNEMAAIIGVLRRRVSGPPKTKTGAGSGRPKKEKVDLNDLA